MLPMGSQLTPETGLWGVEIQTSGKSRSFWAYNFFTNSPTCQYLLILNYKRYIEKKAWISFGGGKMKIDLWTPCSSPSHKYFAIQDITDNFVQQQKLV